MYIKPNRSRILELIVNPSRHSLLRLLIMCIGDMLRILYLAVVFQNVYCGFLDLTDDEDNLAQIWQNNSEFIFMIKTIIFLSKEFSVTQIFIF